MSQLSYWKVLTRRKTLESHPESETKLSRVMGTFDLTALGVGATLGVGVYVLAGHVARDQAGPSTILSFAIAALASLFAGLCYAEFGARVPKAGSAYIYSYVCIGELAAFIVGWNLILEYIIGSASVSKGLSLYLDTLINNTMQTTFRDVAPINWGFLGSYFDFFAFGAAFLLGVALAFGLQKSTIINNCLTVINIFIVLFVIIAGSIKADFKNWQIDPNITDAKTYNIGSGGFFPFGFEGTLKGAATCFFGFVGFDCIATTGEEVKNPRKAIPRSILYSLLIIFLAYFGVSTVLTLMWPYYLQNVNAPLPFVFEQINWPVAQWIVTIGGMIGLIASLFGAMFPLPRIIYAMSQDGLVFRFLGHISPKFKTPIAGTLCAALLTGLMTALFDLTQLVNMLSIGTLLAYTVVAVSITILRYMDNYNYDKNSPQSMSEGTNLTTNTDKITCSSMLIQIFNCRRLTIPNKLSLSTVGVLIFFYCVSCFGFSLTIMYAMRELKELQPWALTLGIIFVVLILFFLLAISVQPREKDASTFTVPLVPLIPGISIFVNIYLMLQLDIYTWIRFGIWMAIGTPIYLICSCIYKIEARNSILSESSYKNGKLEEIVWVTEETTIPNGTLNSTSETLSLNEPLPVSVLEEASKPRTPSPKGSLDDIIPASELSDSIKEIKMPNGNTLFIEEITPKEDKVNDEAKSVIAILDNVLQVEDANGNREFYRTTSIISDGIPSAIETLAIVHSSFENFVEDEAKEKESEENNLEHKQENVAVEVLESPLPVSEKFNEKEDEESTENVILSADLPTVENVKIEKIPLKDEPETLGAETSLASQIAEAIERKRDKTLSEARTTSTSLSSSRKSSIADESLDEEPRVSQKFKERLSTIIARPPPIFIKPKKQDENGNRSKSEVNTPEPHKMKQSKSDADLRYYGYDDSDSEDNDLNNDQNNNSVKNGSETIPKAPKFDPVLYKTIGNRQKTSNRERPKLDIIITKERSPSPEPQSASIPTNNEEEAENLEALPFKEKLAAILKRGPSYRTKIRPEIYPQLPRNRSPTPDRTSKDSSTQESTSREPTPQPDTDTNRDSHKEKFSTVLQFLKEERKPTIPQEQLPPKRPNTIEDALKRLRPVRESYNLAE